MKIVWICQFSNSIVRENLHLSHNIIDNALWYLIYKQKRKRVDVAAWITNAINEFEKIKGVELHIVSPHFDMKYKTEEFELNGIHYHFFKPDNNSFLKRVLKKMLKITAGEFKENRKIVKEFIDKINPGLIHMYGAENPTYSITALDIDISKIPFQVTLQTLMSDPEFQSKSSSPSFQFNFNLNIERTILKKAKYIGSSVTKYREVVWENINSNAILMESGLAVAENIIPCEVEKIYDFVYFAASIVKAADVAIEAFALACAKLPSLTLNIIGGSTPAFSRQLANRIVELGIEKNVIFSGQLATHEDVLTQIQYSKFALIPLKIDHISGTIREAMFSGIPVITTRTHGTPSLNDDRESVLITEQGDYEAMAQNIIRLFESPELTKKLRENGLMTVNERWNNNKIMRDQVKAYQAIIDHHHHNIPIPTDIGTYNPNLKQL